MNLTAAWQTEGNCAGHPDPDLWHYENSNFVDVQKLQVLRSVEAITLCNNCPVKQACLKQGLEPENVLLFDAFGTIWGGLLTSERHQLASKSTVVPRVERRHRRHVRSKIAKVSI